MPGFHLYTADRRTPSICMDDSAVQTAITGQSHIQAKTKGILTPDTVHTTQLCLGHPNPKPHSHLPAAATGPLQSEAMCRTTERTILTRTILRMSHLNTSSEREGNESFTESRCSMGAGDDADSLNNGRNSRDFDSRQVEKS